MDSRNVVSYVEEELRTPPVFSCSIFSFLYNVL